MGPVVADSTAGTFLTASVAPASVGWRTRVRRAVFRVVFTTRVLRVSRSFRSIRHRHSAAACRRQTRLCSGLMILTLKSKGGARRDFQIYTCNYTVGKLATSALLEFTGPMMTPFEIRVAFMLGCNWCCIAGTLSSLMERFSYSCARISYPSHKGAYPTVTYQTS